MEKSGCIGTGVPGAGSVPGGASALGLAVEGLEDVGVAGDGCGEDERVAPSRGDGETREHVVPKHGGSWPGGLSTPG